MSRAKPAAPIVPDEVEDRSLVAKYNYVKRYRRGNFLGKGGFAHVFELISTESGRVYAGKVIAKASITRQSSKRKLHNEIKIHRSLNHANVVRFERYFEGPKNLRYFLMSPSHSFFLCLTLRL